MDKGLFANDGSFMERFKQMQKEKAAAAAAGGSSSAAPKPVNPKQPVVAVAANKRPMEVKKAGPVGLGSGGKLAFSLKKAKVAVAPVFAPDDEDEDAAEVGKEQSVKKTVQADKHVAAAPTGAVAYRLTVSTLLGGMLIERVGMWHYCYCSNLHSVVHALDINQFFK